MTLTELKYILALKQTQHFSKAAEKCHVSQPTLSVAVKKFEESLGLELFERSRHKVSLTPIGEKIAAQAAVVIEQANVISQLAEDGRDPLGSPLSVGAIHTVGPYLFPNFIPELIRLAPNMPLFIQESYTAVLREKLRVGELDAIIIALPFKESDVVTQSLYEEPFVVLLPTDHPLTEYNEINNKQLEKNHVLLLGEGHCFRDQIFEAVPALKKSLNASESSLQSVVDGSSLETLKHMVASGLGVTILPKSAAENIDVTNTLLTTRPLNSKTAKRQVALAWRASFPRHQAIDTLSQSIKKSFN